MVATLEVLIIMVDSSDKRDFRRMSVEIKAHFKIHGHDEFFEGIVSDLSATGILLITGKRLVAGEELEVKVKPEKAVVPPLYARVKVLRVDHNEGEDYHAGCKITEMLT